MNIAGASGNYQQQRVTISNQSSMPMINSNDPQNQMNPLNRNNFTNSDDQNKFQQIVENL